MLARTLILLAAVASVACAAESNDDDSANSANAISGGTVDGSRAKSIVQLYVEKENDPSHANNYCTGVMIAPNKVLTASRCFAFAQFIFTARREFTTRSIVMLGPRVNLSTALSGKTNVSHVAIRAPKALENARDSEIIKGSLAVVTLTAPLAGAEPLRIGVPPADKTPVTAWGYGCNESEKDWGVLRSRKLGWGDWNGYFGLFGTSFTCQPGDRGAAILDADGRVVGVSVEDDAVLPIEDGMLERL